MLACPQTAARYGLPTATLTDNGSVYTSRFTHGHIAFELLLHSLGVTQKNGHPGHPQTQGKAERFHQTLKRWLAKQPRPANLTDLQTLLDTFRGLYNTGRPHRAHHPRATPAQAYTALPKATPGTAPTDGQLRIRHDTVDQFGKLTLRHASRLHHLGIGRAHVLIVITANTVTVLTNPNHDLIASHHIDKARNYWRNQQQKPRPMAGAVTHDPKEPKYANWIAEEVAHTRPPRWVTTYSGFTPAPDTSRNWWVTRYAAIGKHQFRRSTRGAAHQLLRLGLIHRGRSSMASDPSISNGREVLNEFSDRMLHSGRTN